MHPGAKVDFRQRKDILTYQVATFTKQKDLLVMKSHFVAMHKYWFYMNRHMRAHTGTHNLQLIHVVQHQILEHTDQSRCCTSEPSTKTQQASTQMIRSIPTHQIKTRHEREMR